jgi:hypothetical protein
MTDADLEQFDRASEFERILKYVREVRHDMDRIATALERYVEWHRDHPEAVAVFKMFLHSGIDEE